MTRIPPASAQASHLKVGSLIRQLVGDRSLVRSSAILFVGSSIAKGLGFLFSFASARLLPASDYGAMAYALAIIGIATALVNTAPDALTRFLALSRGDAAKRDSYSSNWLVVMLLLLLATIFLTVPFLVVVRLSLPLVFVIILNIAGTAMLAGYMGAQRGVERFAALTSFYIIANAIQLALVVALGLAGLRNAVLFLLVYGCSSFVSFGVMSLMTPLPGRFVRAALDRAEMLAITRFMAPLLFQTTFHTVWYGADILFLAHYSSDVAVGTYAAAKVIASLPGLAVGAVAGVQLPRLARLPASKIPSAFAQMAAFTAVVTIPPTVLIWVFGGLVGQLLYSGKYVGMAELFPWLAVGVGMYGAFNVLANAWLGLGESRIYAVATGAAMIVTLALEALLAPALGAVGAAAGFAAGSAAEFVVIGAYTLWRLRAWSPATR